MNLLRRLLCRVGIHRWSYDGDDETGHIYQESCTVCGKTRRGWTFI